MTLALRDRASNEPTATIRSPRMATSARRAGAPVPSITVPLLENEIGGDDCGLCLIRKVQSGPCRRAVHADSQSYRRSSTTP